jgi:YHS domain-containing protein
MVVPALLAAVSMADVPSEPGLVCAVMGVPLVSVSKTFEYQGLRVPLCCAACEATFLSGPAKVVASAASKGWVFATSYFDVTTGKRIDRAKAKFHSDFGGVRYPFASEAGRKTFLASPGGFAARPAKESLTCPVTGTALKGYSAAAGYADYRGVRYYACCAGCLPAMQKDIAAVVAKRRAKPGTPRPIPAKNLTPMASDKGCCAPPLG